MDYKSIKAECKEKGIGYGVFLYFSLGKGEDEAHAEQLAKNEKITDHEGNEYDSLSSLSSHYEITTGELVRRLRGVYTLEEALTAGYGSTRRYFIHVPGKDTVVVTKKELEDAGIMLDTVKRCIQEEGYTKEMALTSARGIPSVEAEPSRDPSWILSCNRNAVVKQNIRKGKYTRYEKDWLKRYQDVIDLAKEQTGGDINAIRQYHNRQLYDWLVNQRCYRRQGRLKEAQIMMLDMAGFDWNAGFKHKEGIKVDAFDNESYKTWAALVKPVLLQFGYWSNIPEIISSLTGQTQSTALRSFARSLQRIHVLVSSRRM